MERQISEQKLTDKIIGLKPVGVDIDEVSDLSRSFLYSFTLKRSQATKKDTSINRELSNVRNLIQQLVSGEMDDWQSLFECAYGLGVKVENGYDSEGLKRVEKECTKIYAKDLERIEDVSVDGKKSLPEDTVSIFLQNGYQNPRNLAQAIYLAGYSAGVLYRTGEKREIPPEACSDILDTKDGNVFIDLSQYKKQLIDEVQSKAKDFISQVFFQGMEQLSTFDEVCEFKETLIEKLSKLIPDFEKRIVTMIGEKRKRVVNLNGRIVSEWYKECSFYLDQAVGLSDDPSQQGVVAGQLRRLTLIGEVLERDITSGKFQKQPNINFFVNEFMMELADNSDFEVSSQEIYERFIEYAVCGKVDENPDGQKPKDFIPKGLKAIIFTEEEKKSITFSKEEQIAMLDAISPFDQAYTRDLNDTARKDIFYRWIKALSMLADMNIPGGGSNLIRYLTTFREETGLDVKELRKNIAALVEYGFEFDSLSKLKPEKKEIAERCEVLDEICHFIRVVTGLKFESKIESADDLKLYNVNRQFVRMAYVLLNKKIARGEIKPEDIYPVKPGVKYDENNLRFFGQMPGIGVYDKRVKGYPYLQTALIIPGISPQESKRASILLTNLLLKYPFEVAIPTFLFTIYDCYGDIDLNGVVNQLFINRDQRRELKTCFIGGTGEVAVSGNTIRGSKSDIYYQKTDLGLRPITTIRIQLGASTKNDNTMSISPNAEVVIPVDWNSENLREKIKPVVTQLLARVDLSKPTILDAEFFHIHADETQPSNTQEVSGLVAQVLNEELSEVSSDLKVIGRPVIDNAHVVDRLNYDLAQQEAVRYGVEIPEVVFEGSPLQQWIGDQLYRLIDPAKIIRRGDNLYFKVNDRFEVELYTNVGSDNIIQACVLNHIANDIYKLNPQKWNNLFKDYLDRLVPEVVFLWNESGYVSFEEFYYQIINSQKTPEARQLVKDSLFKPITSGFLNEETRLEAQSTLREVLENNWKQVIPVQILEDFFEEQGEKYKALFLELKQQFTLLEKVQIYRITYGMNSGEIKLVSLSNSYDIQKSD